MHHGRDGGRASAVCPSARWSPNWANMVSHKIIHNQTKPNAQGNGEPINGLLACHFDQFAQGHTDHFGVDVDWALVHSQIENVRSTLGPCTGPSVGMGGCTLALAAAGNGGGL